MQFFIGLQDHEMNIRVYREDQDDVEAETWQIVVKCVFKGFTFLNHYPP